MFRLLPSTASCWGSGGKAPGSTGAGLKVLLGVGKAHGFSGLPPALIKRKLPPCGRQLPLNPLCGNIPVKVGSYFRSENLHPTLDNIRRFSRSEDKGKPGILTCPNGQIKTPKPPERKEKKKKITRIQYLCGFPEFLDVVIRHS